MMPTRCRLWRSLLAPVPAPRCLPVYVLHADNMQQRTINHAIEDSDPLFFGNPDLDRRARKKGHFGVANLIRRAVAEMKSNGHERPSVEKLAKLFGPHAFILHGGTADGKTTIHKAAIPQQRSEGLI